jgi:hypothetical protein
MMWIELDQDEIQFKGFVDMTLNCRAEETKEFLADWMSRVAKFIDKKCLEDLHFLKVGLDFRKMKATTMLLMC